MNFITDNGYLTQVEKSDFGNYKLKIPNNEVKIVFTDIIKTWLNTAIVRYIFEMG